MSIARPKSIAHQIDSILRQRIAAGAYPPGSRLPSESVLRKEFEVSRATVRTALNRLAGDGLILRKQGEGTYVNARVQQAQTQMGGMVEYTRLIERSGYAASIRPLAMETRPATAPEAQALKLAPGSEVLSLVRLFLADETPVILASNTMPMSGLSYPDGDLPDGTLTLSHFLERYGRSKIAYAMLDVGAVLVDDADAAVLQLPPGQALLQIDSIFYDQDDTPLACGRSTYDDSRLQLRFIQAWP
jgi:DNA-binding GntR family transcriptional regulator